eukprot:247101-Prymnesium_polylepis.1
MPGALEDPLGGAGAQLHAPCARTSCALHAAASCRRAAGGGVSTHLLQLHAPLDDQPVDLVHVGLRGLLLERIRQQAPHFLRRVGAIVSLEGPVRRARKLAAAGGHGRRCEGVGAHLLRHRHLVGALDPRHTANKVAVQREHARLGLHHARGKGDRLLRDVAQRQRAARGAGHRDLLCEGAGGGANTPER